ncbi:MAG TPA: hypothetical protein VM597_34345 [Gemmataceae bacterium]|jgi:hypothetical protein|nr:hypothetical protein [Gemmataceae bacterium]
MSVRLLTFALLAACGGCQPGPGTTFSAGPSGCRTWAGEAGGVPGLDGPGQAYYEGKRLLVWAAGASGGGGSTHTARGRTSGHGEVIFRDGKTVRFTFDLPEGASGTLDVEGRAYSLADGRVFLLKRAGDGVAVKQVGLDVSGIDPGTADFATIGRADPAVKGFFDPAP